MSDTRPTPETEAAWVAAKELRHENGSPAHGWAAMDMCNLARKLERERDEARERADSKHGLWMAEIGRVTGLEKQLEAMREAIKDVEKILLSIQLNDIFEETMRNHATIALTKLQPFLKP